MTDQDQPQTVRPIKSFVVRGGRLTGSQQKAIAELWPRYGLQRETGLLDQQAVFGRRQPLVFEIGFGMGDSLASMAEQNPAEDFIGVDVHPPGIGNLLRLIQARQLENVRLYQGDARLVLQDCIGEGMLDKVLIFFPDPWHKKRHHKRRLIQPAFIRELLPRIRSGGLLHLATDWENYAEQMLEVLSAVPELENCAGAGQYATAHGRPQTKFERRGQRLGHGVRDLLFRKR